MNKINIKIQALNIPMRLSFKQASSDRKTSESIWVEISNGDYVGYGEGCPRLYVTNENIADSIKWLESIAPQIQKFCNDLGQLKIFLKKLDTQIRKHPSAWCAMECALLDLFARMEHSSIEQLLGTEPIYGSYNYSAILGDQDEPAYTALIKKYLQAKLSDFKIKLSGDDERDNHHINTLLQHVKLHKILSPRIRLDANNLWQNDIDTACKSISNFKQDIFAIEEPLTSKSYELISELSVKTGKHIILDESLCDLDDLSKFAELPGSYIANIKISRVGGIISALELIDQCKKLNWPIIIGAHVGETSILTRVALIAAQYAGDSLIAQEGAFGEMILERDIVTPSLKFGYEGVLKIDHEIWPEIQNHGLGLTLKKDS